MAAALPKLLLPLMLVPAPLLGWAGWRALGELESARRDLEREQTLASLADELERTLALRPGNARGFVTVGESWSWDPTTPTPTEPTDRWASTSARARLVAAAQGGAWEEVLDIAASTLAPARSTEERVSGWLWIAAVALRHRDEARAEQALERGRALLRGDFAPGEENSIPPPPIDATVSTSLARSLRALGDSAGSDAVLLEWSDEWSERRPSLSELARFTEAMDLLRPPTAHQIELRGRVAVQRDRPGWEQRLRREYDAEATAPRALAMWADHTFQLSRDETTSCVQVTPLEISPNWWIEHHDEISGATVASHRPDTRSTETIRASALRDDAGRTLVLGELPPLTIRFLGNERITPLGIDARVWLVSACALWVALAIAAAHTVRRRQLELTQLAQTRTDLVAQVAHELRTPLTVLRMYAETLQSDRLDSAQRAQYIHIIGEEADRLGTLVDRVTAAVRDDERRPVRDRPGSATDIVQRLDRSVAQFNVLMAAEGRSIRRTDSIAAEVYVPCDEEELRQILEVLLDNALRYGGTGDVEVELRVEGSTTESRPETGGAGDASPGCVQVRVRDHGPGIDPEERDRVFQRWFRGRAGRASGRRGAGMGLALARDAARRAHGTLALEHPENGGLCVVLRLSECDLPPSAPHSALPSSPSREPHLPQPPPRTPVDPTESAR